MYGARLKQPGVIASSKSFWKLKLFLERIFPRYLGKIQGNNCRRKCASSQPNRGVPKLLDLGALLFLAPGQGIS
jgi:hypothetical protein